MSESLSRFHGLAAILHEAGVVTPEQIEAGLELHRETGLRIGETLVEIGAATEVDIGWALARQLGLPFVDLSSDTLDPDLLHGFPAGLLQRLHAVPLLRSEEGLSVAFSDPTDAQATAHLEAIARCPIHASVTTPSAIRRVLGTAPGGGDARASRAPTAGGPVVWDRSGANFLHYQVFSAQRAGAAAIQFVAEAGGMRVYHRRPDGLTLVSHEPADAYEALLTQLEMLGAPVSDVAHDLHRATTIDYLLPDSTIRLEVALLAHAGTSVITLRLPGVNGGPTALDQLGLEPIEVARVRDVLQRPAGLAIVSGPIGSGCSTTLACMLAEALREDRSAMVFGAGTLPIPPGRVVFALPGAAARAAWEPIVNAHQPDIVVLDDVVSGEDVTALTAGAGMGRLMLARADWGETFALLEHLGRGPHARSATASRLQLVLQQRLLPAGASRTRDGMPTRARACFETLVVSDALREAIRGAAPARTLRKLAEAEGFRGLDTKLHLDVRSGRLAADVAARALSI